MIKRLFVRLSDEQLRSRVDALDRERDELMAEYCRRWPTEPVDAAPAAPAEPTVTPKPVAWRMRILDTRGGWTDWLLLTRKPCKHADVVEQIEPLYAVPSLAPEDLKLKETALSDLIRAYVRLLETGCDRIIESGGDCDSVEVMERNDPYLRQARAALRQRIQEGQAK